MTSFDPESVDPQAATELVLKTLSEAGIEPTVYNMRVPDESSGPPSYQVSFGHYENLKEIGRGGGGEVYSARDCQTGRSVALKVLATKHLGSQRLIHRFLAEAQITAQLQHPNIVPIYEIGLTPSKRPFFSMKQVEGESLANLLAMLRAAREPAEASLSRLLGIFVKICDALAFAHARGVIHRDLKPANTMIGRFGEVLVMDWGLARVIASPEGSQPPVWFDSAAVLGPASEPVEPTSDGAIVGTVSYMSPEQACGEQALVDQRSDIYSLGAILYEILSLQRPYKGETLKEILDLVRTGELEPPSVRAPERGVPRELEAITLKAMHFEPGRRYQSVADLAEDLQAYLTGRMVGAADYTLWQRGAKWVRRHRVGALIGLLLTAAGLSVPALARLQRRAAARQAGREVAGQASTLHEAYARQLDTLKRLDALPLEQPNGEPIRQRVNAWYEAHARGVRLLEQLAALGRQAPTARSRRAVRPTWVRDQRRALCRRIWRRATDLGHYTLARSWIDRAAADDGLTDAARLDALEQVETARKARTVSSLARARKVLERIEALHRQPGSRPAAERREWLDVALLELLRLNSPALVRMLLERRWLDHRDRWVRQVTIEALGRLGDTRTRGDAGLDAVETLCARLREVDLVAEPRIAIALGRALGFLGDSRAYETLWRKRFRASGQAMAFLDGTRSAIARLPRPASWEAKATDSAALVKQGVALQESGQHRQAIAAFSQALRADPGNLASYLYRGVSHSRLGAHDRAERDFTRVIQGRPDHHDAHRNRAHARRRLGKLDAALLDADRAVALDPQSALSWMGRALVRFELADFKGARSDLDRATTLQPDLAEAWAFRGNTRFELADVQGARADHDKAVTLAPRNARLRVYRATLRTKTGDIKGAEADVAVALRLDPGMAAAYRIRGTIRANRGEHARALTDLRKTLALDPADPLAHLHIAQALLDMGRWQEAKAPCRVALRRHPKAPDPWICAARIELQSGQLEAALKAAHKAVDLGPRRYATHQVLALVLLRRGRYDQALSAIDRAIALDANVPSLHFTRGNLQIQMGRIARAIPSYNRVLLLSPRHGLALRHRAYAKQRIGDYKGALADIDKAVALNRSAIDLDHRGNIKQELRDFAGAISDYDEALKLRPGYILALMHRGNARGRSDDLKGALADFSQALAREPSNPQIYLNRGQILSIAGRHTEAHADYDRALALAPRLTHAYYARALSRIALNQLSGAMSDLASLRKLAPRDWRRLADIGASLASRGHREQARATLRAALDRCPVEAKPRIRKLLATLERR